MSDQILMIKHF